MMQEEQNMKRVFFLVLAAVMITGLFTGCQSMYTTGRNGSATPYATDELYGNVSTTRNGYVNGENRGKYNIDARNTTDQMDNATGYVKYPNSYSGTPMGGPLPTAMAIPAPTPQPATIRPTTTSLTPTPETATLQRIRNKNAGVTPLPFLP